jgi:hypothetical protein
LKVRNNTLAPRHSGSPSSSLDRRADGRGYGTGAYLVALSSFGRRAARSGRGSPRALAPRLSRAVARSDELTERSDGPIPSPPARRPTRRAACRSRWGAASSRRLRTPCSPRSR